MSRYYFNLVGPKQFIPDHEGVEIPDDIGDEIITTIIEELRSEEPDVFVSGGDWSIEVIDELGRTVTRIPL